MKNKLTVPIFYTFTASLILLLMGCSTTRSVPENDALYTGARIKMTRTTLPSKQKKALQSTLLGLTRPQPNSRILGMPFKLWVYNLGSEKGLGAWLRRKYGEAPVLLSELKLGQNARILDNYLENRGFFQVKVQGDTTVKGKKASAEYTVATGPEYKIKQITFPADSGILESAIRSTQSKTLLKPGNPFNLDLIKGERTRIDIDLKEKGFYYFSEEYLLIETDSTLGQHEVNLYIQVKPATPAAARQTYRINNVYIYPNYNLSTANQDTSLSNAEFYAGYYVIDSSRLFKQRVFEQSMQFQPGDLYSRKDHNTTLSWLINLGSFKFVKNRFEAVLDSNGAKLNAFYYLTPLRKKSLRAELTGTSKTNNLVGSQITLGWRHRNIFRGAEQLSINLFGSTEVQVSGNFGKSNPYRVGGEVALSIPRFVVPFLNIRGRSEFVPRTNLLLGYELLNRQNLYTLNSFRGNFGYTWKESLQKEHQLNPFTFNYVKPLTIAQQYIDSIAKNPSLAKIVEQQFIVGSSYTYNFNQLAGSNRRTGIYFNGLLDIAGNIAGLLNGSNWKNNEVGTIFGVKYAQFAKAEIDLRYYKQVNRSSQWANRLILGFGYPYGNSRQLPFVKQFFSGGNNSLRGFRSRTVGPGRYTPPNIGNPGALFLPDQSGDIKLEFNSEYRPKLFSIAEGALFLDAGNVWLLNEDPLKPGAQFSSNFLNELAIDAGFGLRLDFTILLLRLDFAFPLKVPYAANLPNKNMVINLAIGYPF
ncbi:BamA/TamA family outer membrane protein [Haliscomenobacter sp.]|uniref:translocation and assembly module lipoprotein TamL n=1 Tax=Haliscomenobacter sp. TaxID=2717303 RepID=UPI0033651B3F